MRYCMKCKEVRDNAMFGCPICGHSAYRERGLVWFRDRFVPDMKDKTRAFILLVEISNGIAQLRKAKEDKL